MHHGKWSHEDSPMYRHTLLKKILPRKYFVKLISEMIWMQHFHMNVWSIDMDSCLLTWCKNLNYSSTLLKILLLGIKNVHYECKQIGRKELYHIRIYTQTFPFENLRDYPVPTLGVVPFQRLKNTKYNTERLTLRLKLIASICTFLSKTCVSISIHRKGFYKR